MRYGAPVNIPLHLGYLEDGLYLRGEEEAAIDFGIV